MNWERNTLGTISFVLIGAAWFGAPGVLIGQFLGGTVFALVALSVIDAPVAPQEQLHFARQSRLLQLLHLRR